MNVSEATERLLGAAREAEAGFAALGLECKTEIYYHDKLYRQTEMEGARFISVSLTLSPPAAESESAHEHSIGMGCEIKRGKTSEAEMSSQLEGFKAECAEAVAALSGAESLSEVIDALAARSEEEYTRLLKKLKYMQIGSIVTAVIAVALIIIFSFI